MRQGTTGYGRDRRAVAAIEYSLVIALVACAIVASAGTLGGKIAGLWLDGLTRFAAALGSGGP